MAENRIKGKALVLLTGGGHLFQTLLLIEKMKGHFDFDYAVTKYGGPSDFNSIPPGRRFDVVSLSTFSEGGAFRDIYSTLWAVAQYVGIILKTKPDIVVGLGTNNAFPLLLAAFLTRRKRVFMESITRVTTPSKTARIVAKMKIADRLYVQWPALEKNLEGSQFKGNIL